MNAPVLSLSCVTRPRRRAVVGRAYGPSTMCGKGTGVVLSSSVSRNVALRGQGSRQASSLPVRNERRGEATTSPRYSKYAAGTGKAATGTWPVSPLWCNRPSPCAAQMQSAPRPECSGVGAF